MPPAAHMSSREARARAAGGAVKRSRLRCARRRRAPTLHAEPTPAQGEATHQLRPPHLLTEAMSPNLWCWPKGRRYKSNACDSVRRKKEKQTKFMK